MSDNELIAEFMGQTGLTRVFRDKIVPYVPAYDGLWDTLMEVVQKIESIAPTRVVIDCNECKIIGDRRFKVHTMNKKNSVYQCVVQFIKWYNTKQQERKHKS